MSDSPAEYVAELREQNKILRANVVQLVAEKQQLELALAKALAETTRLRREKLDIHDYEPHVVSPFTEVD